MATSYDPGALTPEEEYYWRVDAVNEVDTTPGPEWTFTVADAASLAPEAPTIQSATESPAGSGSVALTWSDNSDVEEQYLVAYSSDGGANYSTPVDVGANTTSYTVSGLDPETTYTLRVTAENEYGSNSDTVEVTTDAISVYHVSASTGDDGNNGQPTTPLATITEALSRASSGDEIRVAGGTYNEVVTVNKPVSIYGSYDAAFTSRSSRSADKLH